MKYLGAKYLHRTEGRLVLQIAIVSLATLVAAAALSLVSIAYANQAVRDAYAGMIATVSQKYPLAEADVVRDIRSENSESIARGTQILNRYGWQDMNVQENSIASALTSRLLPASILFALSVSAAFAFLFIRYQRAVSMQIEGLSNYLQRLDQGDYALDIRDNGEGNFSLLKNDLYKITVRLREQAERLQKDKVYLSDALADISHQIKTPLTSLFVLADLLSGDPPEEDRRKFIEHLRSQLGRIQWLIHSLLRLSRLDAGTAGLKHEPVDIHRLIESALNPLQIPIELKKQQIDVHGDADASFNGDFQWSAEALTNLIKNCVEHTPEGGRIEIAFGANSLYAEITVSDNGEGIAGEDLPHIFHRFYRGRNAGENSIGIGLALAKAIFLEQGGDISVKSQAGQGTSFSVKVFEGVV